MKIIYQSIICSLIVWSCGAPHYRYMNTPKDSDLKTVVNPNTSPPSWALSGEMGEYTRDKYLIGVGRGASQQGADDAARAEIAKVFLVKVYQSVQETTSYQEASSSKGYEGWEKSLGLTQATSTETEKILSGVEVVAREKIGESDYYSFAILSRQKASDSLYEKAKMYAEEANEAFKRGQGEKDALKATRALYQSALSLMRLQEVNADLRVLGLRKPIEPSVQLSKVLTLFSQRLRSEVKFSVSFQGDDADRLRDAVQSALTSKGLVVTDSERAKIEISGVCNLKINKRPPTDWVFVRYEITLGAINLDTGNVIASVGPVTDDVSALTDTQAYERASFVIRNKLVEPFITSIFTKLFGEVSLPQR